MFSTSRFLIGGYSQTKHYLHLTTRPVTNTRLQLYL